MVSTEVDKISISNELIILLQQIVRRYDNVKTMYEGSELAEITFNGDFPELPTRSPAKPQNHRKNLN